jgi:hypothetical protein
MAFETFDNERVARALLTVLESELPDALDAVEALWVTEGVPVTLPDPVEYAFGHMPTVLERASSELPVVAVISANREPRDGAAWGYQDEGITLYVDFFIVGSDETTCNAIANRYAQALVTVLQDNRVVEGYKQADWKPAINLSEASRHPKTPYSDMGIEAEEDFIQLGRVEVTLS